MRIVTTGFAMLSLAALVGCNTSPPGGSGGRVTDSGRSATFTIKAPTLSTTVQQGDTHTVKLAVDRGKDFHDDVTLRFDAPAGLKVNPAEHTVKAGDQEDVQVKVTADKDAPVGEHMVKVTGMPASGSATSVDFKIKIEAAK
jgi:uncharacterized membrane protein